MQSNDTFLRSMAQPYAGPFSWRVQDFRCVPPYFSLYRQNINIHARYIYKAYYLKD